MKFLCIWIIGSRGEEVKFKCNSPCKTM